MPGLGPRARASGLRLHAGAVQVESPTQLRALLPDDGATAEVLDRQRRAAPALLAMRSFDEHAVMTAVNRAVREATGSLALMLDERGLALAEGGGGAGAALAALTAVPARGYAQLPLGTYGLQQLAQAAPGAFGGIDLRRRDGAAGQCVLLFTRGTTATPVVLPAATLSLAALERYVNAALGEQPYAPLALRARDGRVTVAGRATFGLTFAPKESVDGTALGFQCTAYDGCATYTAEDPVHLPDFGLGTETVVPRRTYALYAEPEQRRVGISCAPRKVMLKDGVVQSGGHVEAEEGDVVFTETHGYVRVAAVRAAATDGAAALRLDLEGVGGTYTGALVAGCLEALRIRAEPNPAVAPAAVWPHLLGFRGSVVPRPLACAVVPPTAQTRHLAQGVYQLDHVPYVLVEMMNGTSSPSTMQRAVLADRTLFPFAKVCFVPYRVERQNPAEVQFPEGDRLGPIVLRLRNPNGSLYQTHGVPFTLSLTVVTSEP